MALQKTNTSTMGVVTDYHRISSVTQGYSLHGDYIKVTIQSYASAEYREYEKEQKYERVISSEEFVLPVTTEDFSRQTLYDRIKLEVPAFSGAIDN